MALSRVDIELAEPVEVAATGARRDGQRRMVNGSNVANRPPSLIDRDGTESAATGLACPGSRMRGKQAVTRGREGSRRRRQTAGARPAPFAGQARHVLCSSRMSALTRRLARI